jgi:hypothetical protein
MKKWPLVSIALAFVYLFTLVVPAQAEEEDPPVTFSVLYVSPGQIAFDPEAPYTPDQVIDDAEETIEWAGTLQMTHALVSVACSIYTLRLAY